MTVLHLGHQATDLAGVSTSDITTATDAFDSDLDVNGVKVVVSNEMSHPFALNVDPPTGDLWLQFRFYNPAPNYPQFDVPDTPWITFYDASNEVVARLLGYEDKSVKTSAYGDSQVIGSTTFTKEPSSTNWIDVRVSVGSDITIDLYAEGTLRSTASATNANGKGKPTRVLFNNVDLHGGSVSFDYYYAHIAVMDDVSTVGRRFARQTPQAAGTYTQWNGSVSSLSDGDILTRMDSDTANQRQSMTLTGPTGPAGAPINGVHVKAVAQAGASGPSQLAGSLRMSSTAYDESNQVAPSTAPGQMIFSWATNPIDGTNWESADLPSEIGIVSRA